MRRKDIQLGVPYAYRPPGCLDPIKIVFVATDETVQKDGRSRADFTWSRTGNTNTYTRYGYVTVGFPALGMADDDDASLERARQVTIETYTSGEELPGLNRVLVARFQSVLCPWDAHVQQEKAKKQEQDALRRKADEARLRFRAVREILRELGVTTHPSYSPSGYMSVLTGAVISLEGIETLAKVIQGALNIHQHAEPGEHVKDLIDTIDRLLRRESE